MVPGEGISRAVIFFDDFLEGGFCLDAALGSDAGPTAKFAEVENEGQWYVVNGTSDPAVLACRILDDEPGGVLAFTADNVNNAYNFMHVNGEAFALDACKDIYFETRFKCPKISETNFFIGLHRGNETNLIDNANMDDGIGFRNDSTDDDIDYVVAKNATVTGSNGDTLKGMVDATWVRLGFKVLGTTLVKFYVEGEWVKTINTNLPDDEGLTIAVQVRNEAYTTADVAMEIDYILCVQER